MEFKVNHITNLSAARYFSSFGISNFGFNLDENSQHNLNIDAAKTIAGWLYQPTIILEIGLHQTLSDVVQLQEQFNFSSIEINSQHPELKTIIANFNKVWLKVDAELISSFNFDDEQFANVIFIINIKNQQVNVVELMDLVAGHTIFLDFGTNLIDHALIDKINPDGLCVQCMQEEAIGKLDLSHYEQFIPLFEDNY